VVDTVGFLPGVLNAPVRHSDKLHVVERFTFDPAAVTLTRNVHGGRPGVSEGAVQRARRDWCRRSAYTEDKCKEQGFLDYSKQTKR
jgi:hypothetical protein